MTTPRYNPQIAAQGLAWLTGAYRNQKNIRTWLYAVLAELQHIEDAYWGTDPANYGTGILTSRFLATAQVLSPGTNSVLDALGALVGQPRAGLSDSDYKVAIYLRIAVNRSTARTVDWSNFAGILLRTTPGPVGYMDGGPGPGYPPIARVTNVGATSFALWCYNCGLNPVLVASILAGACTLGVRGVFIYTTWPFTSGPTGDLQCTYSKAPTVTGNGTLGWSGSNAYGGPLAASLGMN